MGRASRPRPARLAEKLRQVREKMNLSQEGIIIRLKLQDSTIDRRSVSGYELGLREPPLDVLLAYSRLANVYVEVLIDNELDLPEKLPSIKKSKGIKRRISELFNR